MALHQIGFLPESEVITDPDTFGAGRLDGPMPRNPEELLAFVCDERCKNRAGHTQEELDAICAKCPLGQLYEDAEAQDLRIRERSERALREHIEGVRHAEDTLTALLGGHEALAYAKLSRVAYIECDDTMSSRDLVEAIERSIGLPNGYGTIWRRVNGIREFFNTNKGYLLIIDEADKLVSKYTQKKMEILRAVFDQSDVGLVIAGEPKLEAQIKTYLVRMANRVDFYASLRGLSPSEVEGYLTDFQIEPEALVELKARACNMQTGCFRLLDRTLSNVRRILKETGEETVTVKTIAQASSMMML